MNKTALAASLAAASLFAGISPAIARDNQPFNGLSVGATTGYDSFSAGDDEDDNSSDGIVYGVTLGYDVNLGGVVLGAEAELTGSGVSASAFDVLEEDDQLTLSAGRDIYAGLRIGVPVSSAIMLFAKGGYTNQRFNATYTLDGDTESVGENLDGFRLGGGVEVDFGKPFARLEYRYSDYGSFSDAELETSRHQIVLTAGLRF